MAIVLPKLLAKLVRLAGVCIVGLLGTWPASCGGSAVLQAADSGDLDAFRTRLSERIAGGEVDVDEAQDIALRLMRRQIEAAQGPSGRRGLDSIEPCADAFAASLAARSSHDDEVGAHAAMIRVASGQVQAMGYARYLTREQAHWRAVAARTLFVPEPTGGSSSDADALVRAGRWRRQLMTDSFAAVRRAALEAAARAADPRDTDEVLEAARLDPDPKARAAAILAAGAIGNRQAVLGLKDLWSSADEDQRVAIVKAWTAAWRKGDDAKACTGSQGVHAHCVALERLTRVSEMGEGMPALRAAFGLIEGRKPSQADGRATAAVGVIERMIDEAPSRIRVAAIERAPLAWPHLLEAVVEARKEKADDSVVVAAAARMSELGSKEREDAIGALREIAKGDGLAAEAARDALVAARDDGVVALLERDAHATSALMRARTARHYAQLGQVSKALSMLADADAHVRSHTACALLEMDD